MRYSARNYEVPVTVSIDWSTLLGCLGIALAGMIVYLTLGI